MVKQLNKLFYNTVLSQCFSPCGNYLITGDIYGTLSVFHITKLLNANQADENDSFSSTVSGNSRIQQQEQKHRPHTAFVIKPDVQINSLVASKHFLLIGTVGAIYAYAWKTVKAAHKAPKPSWSIDLPNNSDDRFLSKLDVNALILNEEDDVLYAACGDHIYVYHIETRKLLKQLKGHKDFVHSIKKLNNRLISGGEDGQVLLWDVSNCSILSKLKPSDNDKVCRPELGGWIGAVDINEDWMLCGGGPRLSLWHMRNMTSTTIFPLDDKGIHVAEIYEDKILAGGRSSLFYQMSFNGDIITEIPTTPVTTYSAIHTHYSQQKILSIAGSSPRIDICNNFNYKNLLLSLY